MKTVRSSPRQSSTFACTSGIAANRVAMLRQNASCPRWGLTSGCTIRASGASRGTM